VGVILTASSEGVETGLQIGELRVSGWVMTESRLVAVVFGVLMCAMSLAASYYEAKEKSKADSEDTGL